MRFKNKNLVPWAQVIPRDAVVASMTELSERLLEPNAMVPTTKELIDLAYACHQRLIMRL